MLAARLRLSAPLLLLLLALATLFVFDGGRDHFYRYHYVVNAWNSGKNLALADNLSPAHNFRQFIQLYPEGRPDAAGDAAAPYEPYARFPIGGHALIKLVIRPFGDDLSAKIFAARLLMLLLFSAAALLAWHALRRLTGSPWAALAAVLLACSSNFLLYVSDIVSNEMVMDLFGMMLVFHGMVIYEQEGRFRQLLAKSCAALLLGWHIYALLLPFIVLGLARALLQTVKARSAARRPQPDAAAAQSAGLSAATPADWAVGLAALLRSRYLLLGVAALLFGMALLSANFANEYRGLNGAVPLTELPSFQSMLNRTGLDTDAESGGLDWGDFLWRQFFNIGVMSLSQALPGYGDGLAKPTNPASGWIFGAGIVAVIAGIAGVFLLRPRMLFAVLALSGFCWSLPMRYNAANHFWESIFYLGLTLVVFLLPLRYAGRRWGPRPLAVLSVAAAAVFAFSAWQMSRVGQSAEGEAFRRAEMADFQTFRPLTRGKSVFLDWPPAAASPNTPNGVAVNFYLAGSRISNPQFQFDSRPGIEVRAVDFVVSGQFNESATLTPDNRQAFLYHSADFLQLYQPVLSGPPAARAEFSLHRHNNQLIYTKESCDLAEIQELFFLHLYPAQVSDLPEYRQRYGYGNRDFRFERHGAIIGGVCFARVPLPEYEIVSIRTGQYTPGQGRSWEVEFPVSGPPERAAAP